MEPDADGRFERTYRRDNESKLVEAFDKDRRELADRLYVVLGKRREEDPGWSQSPEFLLTVLDGPEFPWTRLVRVQASGVEVRASTPDDAREALAELRQLKKELALKKLLNAEARGVRVAYKHQRQLPSPCRDAAGSSALCGRSWRHRWTQRARRRTPPWPSWRNSDS